MAIAPPRSRAATSRPVVRRPPARRPVQARPPAGRPGGPYRPRHRRPPRYGLRRFFALLILFSLVSLGWKAVGLLDHRGARIAAKPVVAGGGGLPPLAGPRQITRTQTHNALDRFISYGYPVYCGGGTKPLVALTFDDGPGPYTKEVVDVLRQAGARATFFIVAKEIDGWPQLADEPRQEATVGAIGDHTWDHIDLTTATADELQHEVVDSQQLIEQHSGADVRLFRPPYGRHDLLVDREIQAQGMVEVLWSVDSQDGETGTSGPDVLQNVEDGLRPGAIVLMHENRGTTLRVLPQILAAVRAKGLHTVTVPELLAEDPPSLAQLKSGNCH
jgi:peptidoglycan/xylan/chitin deacetylase (PgdA/CDA1 family)